MGLRASLAALGAGKLALEAVRASDGLELLQNKLRLVTRDQQELALIQEEVIRLAQETRQRYESVGVLYARLARSSKELGASQSQVLTVTKAVSQAIQISGNTAIEAEAGMIQLSQALASGVLRGDELRSVLEQMPRVAQAIADGLGTTVGKLRALGAAGKLRSEQVFNALISQSQKLNQEFGKLRPTIGQTFTVAVNELKLATAEFLRTSGAVDVLTTAITKLAKGIRESLGLLRFLGEQAAATLHGAAADDVVRLNQQLALAEKLRADQSGFSRFRFFGKDGLVEFYDNEELDAEIRRLRDQIADALTVPLPNRPKLDGSGTALLSTRSLIGNIEEINVAVRKITDKNGDALRELEEETRTSAERISAEYARLQAALQTLLDEKKITPTQFNERIDEFIKDNIEIDINAIRRLYKDVQVQTSELGEFMEGVWQGVGKSIQATLSDAIYEWRLSWRSLLDIARRALADITSAIITSGINKALTSQLSSSGGSSAGTAGFLAGLGKLFGLAGGGRFDGARIVGEDGPELVTGRGRVFNQRQMAFAGVGGAQITYAPQITFRVETKDEDGMRREVAEFVETRLAQDRAEFTRQLQRSGVEVKG